MGPQIPRVAGIFVLPLITQFLTSVDYGVYGIFTSYVGLFSVASDLGFSILLVNSYYKHPTRWKIIWRQLHFYLLLWSIFYGLALGICLYFIAPPAVETNLSFILVLVCAPIILFNPTIIMGAGYFQYSQKPLYAVTVLSLVGALTILLNLYTIAFLHMGYMGWFISTALATLVQFLLFAYPVYFKHNLQPLFSFRKKFLARQLKLSLPTVPHNYSAYILNSSDRIVMDRVHVKVADIGSYNMAYMFGNYFEVVGNALGMAMGPLYLGLFSKRDAQSGRDIHFITHWLQVSFIAGGFMIALWCKELMDLLIRNSELKQVYPLAIIIIMGYVYRPYYWVSVNKLQFMEKTSKLWRISFVASILNLGLNIILIPIFGIVAAAVTTFVALLYMGFSGHFLKSFKEGENEKYYPVQMIIAIVSLTVCVYCLRDLSIAFKVMVSVGIITPYLGYYWSKRNIFKEIRI